MDDREIYNIVKKEVSKANQRLARLEKEFRERYMGIEKTFKQIRQ